MSPTSGISWVDLGCINNYKEPQLWLVFLKYSADVTSISPWVVTFGDSNGNCYLFIMLSLELRICSHSWGWWSFSIRRLLLAWDHFLLPSLGSLCQLATSWAQHSSSSLVWSQGRPVRARQGGWMGLTWIRTIWNSSTGSWQFSACLMLPIMCFGLNGTSIKRMFQLMK